jgi:hypothetical protein
MTAGNDPGEDNVRAGDCAPSRRRGGHAPSANPHGDNWIAVPFGILLRGLTLLTESSMAKGEQKSAREKKKPKKKAEEGNKKSSSYKQEFGKK